MTPSAKREVLEVLIHEHGVAVRRACQAVRLSRAAYYRPPRSRLGRDTDVVTALNNVVARHSRWGFWKCFYRLRRAGHWWNHKRVYRVYCALRLNLPRRTKRRRIWTTPPRCGPRARAAGALAARRRLPHEQPDPVAVLVFPDHFCGHQPLADLRRASLPRAQ